MPSFNVFTFLWPFDIWHCLIALHWYLLWLVTEFILIWNCKAQDVRWMVLFFVVMSSHRWLITGKKRRIWRTGTICRGITVLEYAMGQYNVKWATNGPRAALCSWLLYAVVSYERLVKNYFAQWRKSMLCPFVLLVLSSWRVFQRISSTFIQSNLSFSTFCFMANCERLLAQEFGHILSKKP